MQTFQALHEIHSHGIIHRDIKPENIMVKFVNNTPQVKIIDFDVSSMNPHVKNKVAGTIEYMAPELLTYFVSGVCEYNQSCDFYSLGYTFTKWSHKLEKFGEYLMKNRKIKSKL